MATEKGHMKIVVHLVDKGAEINTIDDAGVSVYRESVDLNLSFLLSQHIYLWSDSMNCMEQLLFVANICLVSCAKVSEAYSLKKM